MGCNEKVDFTRGGGEVGDYILNIKLSDDCSLSYLEMQVMETIPLNDMY